ncbi:major facilitator superfamily domain-containing protein [Usnea florida]
MSSAEPKETHSSSLPNEGIISSIHPAEKEEVPETTFVTCDPPVPYTTFTKAHKYLITVILTCTMLASPLTATIYLPLLPLLARHFRVSIQAINLTITLYIVFQAISPVLFATASDSFGRRPILLVTYAIYTLSSLGLALNKSNYAILLVLRALQSLGASAVLAIAYGVIADVCPPAERGSMQGPTMGAANVAVCLGPVIGGLVALRSGSYEWVFWALVIFGGGVLLFVGVGLPETARNVVGNGSAMATGWERSWWDLFRGRSRRKCGAADVEGGSDANSERERPPKIVPGKKAKFKLANPVAAIRILFWKDTALVLWMAGSPYAVWYAVQASIPSIYKDIYGFNELQIGLSYLTGGVGVVSGGYLNGKLMDRNYKATARSIGHTIDKVSGDDLNNFPIERARARSSYYILAVYITALAGYGWAVQARAHEAVPLVLQYVLAALCTCFQQTFNALLVDIFPASPSTAAASGNITRCALSAVVVAVLQPLVDVMGRGWFFTTLTVLSGGGGLVADWLVKNKGMEWRRKRIDKASKAHSDDETRREV